MFFNSFLSIFCIQPTTFFHSIFYPVLQERDNFSISCMGNATTSAESENLEHDVIAVVKEKVGAAENAAHIA